MLESFSSLVFPAPPEIDLTDEEVLKSFLERLPTSALYIVLFAHITCSFIGGAVVAAVTIRKSTWGCHFDWRLVDRSSFTESNPIQSPDLVLGG